LASERGDDAEAERLLRRTIALSERHFPAHYDLGRLFVRAKRYDEAVIILRRAERLDETDPGVHYQLFTAYSRLKRKAEAEKELEIFRKLDEERQHNGGREGNGKSPVGVEGSVPKTRPAPATDTSGPTTP
jgi:tetratricopeptide (TPR) repeat protein